MFDLRPVGFVIGLLVAVLGLTMIVPMLMDLADGNAHWPNFAISGFLSCLCGGALAIATANSRKVGLTVRQTFLLTTSIWLILPIFGGLPFMFGATEARFIDAFFEGMSGMTTTGSTVFSGLDDLPRGLLLWRGLLQWFGGVGIIVVAMVFLPELKVGGMQIFRTESFETFGKILPRAAEMARSISGIYVGLTIACVAAYLAVGLQPFDAVVHALTTLSTGGFSTYDASFGTFQGPAEYVASVFMILASMPFTRYVQFVAGSARPLWRDVQVRDFLAVISVFVLVITLFRIVFNGDHMEHSFREALFNVTSIISGTGYASVDYQLWGHFPIVLFFLVGLIGGCAGSTCCSVKVFRYRLLMVSLWSQMRKIHSPSGIFRPQFDGRTVSEDVLSSVMAFFILFMVSLAVLSALLAMTGLDMITSISGAATALANVGPGLGDQIGPSGNFAGLNDTAKWLLIFAMLLGRLELMSVFVLFSFSFWRR
ncbi:MAG: TrkH family potassium uptake protein [Rhodobacteraceae bacterium]|nr:TrkH family potassium uptake protein [Paracoccaceae bacterium]